MCLRDEEGGAVVLRQPPPWPTFDCFQLPRGFAKIEIFSPEAHEIRTSKTSWIQPTRGEIPTDGSFSLRAKTKDIDAAELQ
jgi:hypothetical protein